MLIFDFIPLTVSDGLASIAIVFPVRVMIDNCICIRPGYDKTVHISCERKRNDIRDRHNE